MVSPLHHSRACVWALLRLVFFWNGTRKNGNAKKEAGFASQFHCQYWPWIWNWESNSFWRTAGVSRHQTHMTLKYSTPHCEHRIVFIWFKQKAYGSRKISKIFKLTLIEIWLILSTTIKKKVWGRVLSWFIESFGLCLCCCMIQKLGVVFYVVLWS